MTTAEAIASFGRAVAERPNASHEDIRDAFTPVLESLGYRQRNRFHETPLEGGRLDTRLTSDDYVTVAVVEYKSRRDPYNERQLVSYAQNLHLTHCLFVSPERIVMLERAADRLVEHARCEEFSTPSGPFLRQFVQTLQKPTFPLSSRALADHCDSLMAGPISVRDNAREFLGKLGITESPFGQLVDAAFLLIRDRLRGNGFERKTFVLWSTYFSPTLKERGGERRFKAWRQHLLELLGHTPTSEDVQHYLFALETSYALVSRLLLAQVSGESALSMKPLAWLSAASRRIDGDRDLRDLKGAGLQLYVVNDIVHSPDGLFSRLTQIFPSIFEEDFFDWWVDSVTAYSLTELKRFTDPTNPDPALVFARALVGIMLTMCAFSFSGAGSDFLGDLYQQYFDSDTRKALGEFYTPLPIVDQMLNRVGYLADRPITEGQTLIDPACGSGTFLIRAIARYFVAAERLERPDWPRLLRNLCDGLAVCGLDINPFAVVIAQVNYALGLVPYYSRARRQEQDFRIRSIPVFRSDTLRLPANHIETFDPGTPVAISLPVGDLALSLKAPTPGMLRRVGAANIADAFQLVRSIYQAARTSVIKDRPLDDCLLAELGDSLAAIRDDPALESVIESLVGSMRRLSAELGDGRMLKWVGDELLVTTLKVSLHYDYIVCNPPYVTAYRVLESQWDEYESLGYELVAGVGKRDLAYPFLEWAIRRVRDGGRLAFIMTDKWMEWGGREKVRRHVLENSDIVEIVDSQWVEFFEEASNSVAIVVLTRVGRRLTNPLVPLVGVSQFPQPTDEFYANLDVALTKIYDLLDSAGHEPSKDEGTTQPGSFFLVNRLPRVLLEDFAAMGWSPLFRMNSSELRLLLRLRIIPQTLSDCPDFSVSSGRRIFEGAFFAGKSVFVLSEEEASPFLGRSDPIVTVVDGTDIEPFGVMHKAPGTKDTFLQRGGKLNLNLVRASNLVRNKSVVFPYEARSGEWRPVTAERLSSGLRELLLRKAELAADSDRRVRDAAKHLAAEFVAGRYQWIHSPRKPEHVTAALQLRGTRLIWRDASRGNSVCHLEQHVVPLHTCYFAVAQDPERAAYYQGLMSSSLLEFFHKGIGPAMPGGTSTSPRFRYEATYVESWPVVPFESCPESLRSHVVRLVKRIRDITSSLYSTSVALSELLAKPIEGLRNSLGGDIDFSSTEALTISLEEGSVVCPKPLSDRNQELVRVFLRAEFDKLGRLRHEFLDVSRQLDLAVLEAYGEAEAGETVSRFLERTDTGNRHEGSTAETRS